MHVKKKTTLLDERQRFLDDSAEWTTLVHNERIVFVFNEWTPIKDARRTN